MEIDPLRQSLLDCQGHALVVGGPGSGKTTIALRKALKRIEAGLLPGQSVLFLSFSRAAVARIVEASKAEIPREQQSLLNIQTFHSFFWNILATHSYLLGVKKRLKILLPHDERSLSAGVHEDDLLWPAWITERQRLFIEEGRVPFDFFAPQAASLFERSDLIVRLAENYPLVIVDEAQDTNPDAWRCIELVAQYTQVICLADLEQQIFDYLPGIGPERVDDIKLALDPLFIDLGEQNHRSPNSEIAVFGKDILTGSARGSSYLGVSVYRYNQKSHAPATTIRIATAILQKKIKTATGAWGKRIAILLPSGVSAARISAALNAAAKPMRHKLLFDEAEAMLAARFAAFFLEPVAGKSSSEILSSALVLMSELKRASGSSEVAKLTEWAEKVKAGKLPRAGFVTALQTLIANLHAEPWTGNPAKDWVKIKAELRSSQDGKLGAIAKHLDYLIAFNRGRRIASNLAEMWQADGQYSFAREALEAALAQDQLIDGMDDPNGIQIMTIHKSKGKQFDGVIVYREGRHNGDGFVSSFVWRDDPPPYHRSRKILRVGVTRARTHTLLVEPVWPSCPLLSGHRL